MLETVSLDSPPSTLDLELTDGAPRTFREAQNAWESLHERNQGIRARFQAANRKFFLLRSPAMLEAWQS